MGKEWKTGEQDDPLWRSLYNPSGNNRRQKKRKKILKFLFHQSNFGQLSLFSFTWLYGSMRIHFLTRTEQVLILLYIEIKHLLPSPWHPSLTHNMSSSRDSFNWAAERDYHFKVQDTSTWKGCTCIALYEWKQKSGTYVKFFRSK